jgi:hypothetical protein
MDAFDYTDVNEAPPPKKSSGRIWDILTILALVGFLIIGCVFLVIFLNPQSALNPFPPQALPTLYISPTPTPTGRVLPPTWTISPSPEPSVTYTPGPTATPLVTDTPISGTASITVTPGGYSFALQSGSPSAIQNIYFPEAGCSWMGVGGQALDLTGAPVIGLIVQLGGSLEGRTLDTKLSLTGTATQLGPGGFLFELADHPIASDDTLWIQLNDQAGLPLSDKILFDTFSECEKNQIIIYLKQVK